MTIQKQKDQKQTDFGEGKFNIPDPNKVLDKIDKKVEENNKPIQYPVAAPERQTYLDLCGVCGDPHCPLTVRRFSDTHRRAD